MLDIMLLRILKHRKEYMQIAGRVPREAMDKTTLMVMDDMGFYFEKLPEATQIDVKVFLPLFRSRRGADMAEDSIKEYERLLPQIRADVPEAEKAAVMFQLLELRLNTELAETLAAYEAGDVANLHAELTKVSNDFAMDAEVKAVDYIRDDIADLMDEEGNEDGVVSRMTCLRESMRGMRGGDSIILAGRPDKGKTTYLASEATFWAPQLPPEKNILWLNNEGLGKRIIPRLYQSALGATLSEMRQMLADGTLKKKYCEVVGREDKIRVVDIHGMDTYGVENVIRQNDAGIVILDMIDHIRGFRGEARTDLILEEMYKWARTLCVKYEYISVATSQISVEGDGMLFPTLGMLKDSKTGKQGACDAQIMIGASNDPGMANLRGIGLPKNKLRREGYSGDPRAQVAFKPQIARFEDMPVGMAGEGDENEEE